MFFSSWYSLLRILVVGVLAYVTLVVFVRLAGKRSLAQFNAFDFVVTVALGSTLASTLLSKNVAYLDGALALAVLLGLQFVVAWTTNRWPPLKRLVSAEPGLVFFRGEFLDGALRRERVTRADVLSALRGAQVSSPDEVEAVVLETTGTLSVLTKSGRVLDNVERAPERRQGREEGASPGDDDRSTSTRSALT